MPEPVNFANRLELTSEISFVIEFLFQEIRVMVGVVAFDADVYVRLADFWESFQIYEFTFSFKLVRPFHMRSCFAMAISARNTPARLRNLIR